MDEDMSELRVEFRAQRTPLQALHDTQQEHRCDAQRSTARRSASTA